MSEAGIRKRQLGWAIKATVDDDGAPYLVGRFTDRDLGRIPAALSGYLTAVFETREQARRVKPKTWTVNGKVCRYSVVRVEVKVCEL